jgi:hypothetical protein
MSENPQEGGPDRNLQTVAKGLLQLGFNFHLISTFKPYSAAALYGNPQFPHIYRGKNA